VGRQNSDATMSFVVKTARTYDPDPAHSEHVTRLALSLFDELSILHKYGRAERFLLEIAGRLHDIGWSRVVSGKHHKLSFNMILESDIPGLGKKDLLTCALIARYHTKALPDPARHEPFASLDDGRRRLVEWLAGMLRVADGLDCSHVNLIRKLTCTVNGKTVLIHLDATGNCPMELAKAIKKQDLLVKITGRTIEYQC
jgi:exopolyphosphatase/pppGpp-phosphohydrolase